MNVVWEKINAYIGGPYIGNSDCYVVGTNCLTNNENVKLSDFEYKYRHILSTEVTERQLHIQSCRALSTENIFPLHRSTDFLWGARSWSVDHLKFTTTLSCWLINM